MSRMDSLREAMRKPAPKKRPSHNATAGDGRRERPAPAHRNGGARGAQAGAPTAEDGGAPHSEMQIHNRQEHVVEHHAPGAAQMFVDGSSIAPPLLTNPQEMQLHNRTENAAPFTTIFEDGSATTDPAEQIRSYVMGIIAKALRGA